MSNSRVKDQGCRCIPALTVKENAMIDASMSGIIRVSSYTVPDSVQDMVDAGFWTEKQAEKALKLLATMLEPIPVRFITDEMLDNA